MSDENHKVITRALSYWNSILLAIVTFFFIQLFQDFKDMKTVAIEQRIEMKKMNHQVNLLEVKLRDFQDKLEEIDR